MINVIRLVLILALNFGAAIAPDVSFAEVSAMVQMDETENPEKSCGGCISPAFAGGVPCEGGCPVPCDSSGTAGLFVWSPTALLAMFFGDVVLVAEPLIPLGTNPTLDPFPPKLPV